MSKEVDLTSLSDDEKINRLRDEIKALKREEKILVSSDQGYFSVIEALLEELKGEFIWAPFANSPRCQGEIIKTDPASSLQNSIIGYMTFDHKRCDGLYADAEAAWQEGKPEVAAEKLKAFNLGMERHLGEEENILFPAFTEATGMVGGPVQVMIMEHDQMRGVLKQMMDAINANDLDTAFANGDTMVILMQQHNVKEEGILYPMIEQHMTGDMEETVRKLQLYSASEGLCQKSGQA